MIEEIAWFLGAEKWEESTDAWISCAQSEVLNSGGEYGYMIGDGCIEELREDGYSFPSVFFFIAFPVTALLRFDVVFLDRFCVKK